MKRPGARLRALAARLCSAKTMARFIDPTIADLQTEYAAAVRSGSTWTRRTALVEGYFAFAKVAVWCALSSVAELRTNWNQDDHSGLVRVVWRSAMAVPCITLLFVLPELSRVREMLEDYGSDASQLQMMAYLLPSTLPLSLPLGLAFGAALGAHGREPSRRLIGAILLVALVTAGGSLASFAWLIPASNQWYREAIMQQPLVKGDREMSFAELTQALAAADVERGKHLLFEFHKRLSIAGAPVTFAALALMLVMRRRLSRTFTIAAIAAASFGYYVALFLANGFANAGVFSPRFGAWMPQLALLLTTIAVGAPSRFNRIRA